MARFKACIYGKGLRLDTLQKKLHTLFPQNSEENITVTVSKDELPESRADRFEACKSKASEAREEAESLRDELQEWFDNLPEAFQQGDKGSALEEAISNLDTFISSCEEAEGTDVEFPGMY